MHVIHTTGTTRPDVAHCGLLPVRSRLVREYFSDTCRLDRYRQLSAPRIRDEAGESGDGRQWRLGPIDLETGVVEVEPVPRGEDQADPPAAGR